jgi:type IV secretory pathway protease TraF
MRVASTLRWTVIVAGSLAVAAGFWSINALRVNLNGSNSLPENAFVMWTWPQLTWRGAVIAATPPPSYGQTFEGLLITKKIVGLPGDVVTHDGDAVCVAGQCFALFIRDGRPFAPPLAEGEIPEGFYAAFGASDDSLDSRYATIGLFEETRIVAVGIGTNIIPHWKDLKAWADARGW